MGGPAGLNAEPADAASHPRQHRRPRRFREDGYHIEPLAQRHIRLVVPVLAETFPDSLLVALGPAFLEELLDSYVSLPGGCGYVCSHGEGVAGFVVGTEDSGRHRRTLLRRRWASILLRVLQGLVLSPWRAWPLARYLRFYLPLLHPANASDRAVEDTAPVPPASLVLLGVSTAHRRRGIARRLTRAFLEEMARRGVNAAKLAVAADNEAALAFYLSEGWRAAGRHRTPDGKTA